MSDFGDRLYEAMCRVGMRASDLAVASGVGKSDISNYLKGKYKAKQDKVYLLAQALGVDPGWLMTGMASEAHDQNLDADRLEALHQNPRLGMLFDRQRRMSEKDIEAMLAIANSILRERDNDN